MNILTVEGVAKSYGTRVLFDDVTFAVDGGQKLGLIGLNGAGKTTLLKIIAGMAEADKGEIWRNPKARIHYLPQEPQFDPGRSVLESVLDGDLPVMDVLRRYEAAVEAGDDEAVLKLTGEMDEKQAWELEQITQDLPRYEGLLKGLNAAIAAAGSDYETVESLLKEQEETKAKVDELTERWCELEDLKES